MMQDVQGKLNPNCNTKSRFQQDEESFHQHIGIKFKEETIKCYILSRALYGAETLTFRKVNQKYLESFEMCCRRRMEKINWNDCVKIGVLQKV
jgi:hypothetical protein